MMSVVVVVGVGAHDHHVHTVVADAEEEGEEVAAHNHLVAAAVDQQTLHWQA